MVSAHEVYKKIKNSLSEKEGVFSPGFEAREIVKGFAGFDPLINGDTPIGGERLAAVEAALERRLRGEPLQYIFGKWEFYGYEFVVGKGVLIPRPETELLVELALGKADKNSTVLDLCSGTGCIPVSIALKSGARCYAVELYDEAFGYLEKNISLNGAKVTALKADALDGGLLEGIGFDIICTNPPYLTRAEMNALQKEVSFEPETALYGGENGLSFYERLIPLWAGRLKAGGLFLAEIGETQGEAVSEMMRAAGLCPSVKKDYGGADRVAAGVKKS